MKLAINETEEHTNTEPAELHTETEQESRPIEALAGQFGLDGQIFAAQLVNFLIVFVVLWWFAYKPIVKKLEEREEKIEKSVKQANDIERRMKVVEDERGTILAEAKKEARSIIEKAQKQGEERGQEIVVAAKSEVERVINKGKQQLADEKAGMMRELRKDIVEITVAATGKILKDGIDKTKSQTIAEEVVNEMTR
ncbi:MAG: F0F1 ATP synthase subunit B [Patescibacteria group bacterium]